MTSGSRGALSQNHSTWFVTELIVKITVQEDTRNVVHKNLVLIEAESATDAYDKAMTAGAAHTMSYLNPQGRKVNIEFVGLGRLNAVYDHLEDGAELLYEEYVGIPDEEINGWVTPKHLLSVFRGIEPSPGPDYSSAEVLNQAAKLID